MALVQIERNGTVGTIVLDRPESRNALNLELVRDLERAGQAMLDNTEIEIIILRGNGQSFCAGGDVAGFAENLYDLAPFVRSLLEPLNRFVLKLASSTKLSVAAVHGSAAGAGLSLAAMCDMCVAEEDTRFVPAYAALGISPDGGGTFGLARAMGTRRALQVLLTERSFSAVQGHEWGLVTKLARKGELLQDVDGLARQLMAIGKEGVSSTKRLLQRMDSAALESILLDETESILRCMGTDGFRNAVARFADKSAA